ncbi:LLM class flavin-dependent oxidoreductase [Paenibacillus rigui]|uniref:LLM class flavin-dependent oxidoreductase n=1 Tax=Paenibacillus rigui TaxID=554312 RepID=A0A229UTR5_9BACL|nr:LLM class flavin-dependent oxidoreductase [Paenibacillus rigui]OXM86750.1 LLM class flavin-dependent oxidoreductase [Paenibacillus rigui]
MPKKAKRQLILGCALSSGSENSIWKHPRHWSDAPINIRYFQECAQKAEEGKMDFIFVGDTLFVNENSPPPLINRLEPLTLLTAVAGVTKHIGLVGTLSTTYSEPYNVARLFSSLDHISNGRAGWNIVTTALANTALNFSKEAHLEHDQRYEVADEFVEVTKGLWDSWEEGAFIRDKEKGVFFDQEKLHVLDHRGKYFSVKGPLSSERTKQGYPVLVQAGSSDAGIDFAAKHADIVFTHQGSLDSAQAFYRKLKSRVHAHGREPEHLHILPGVSIIVSRTEEEAQRKLAEIDGLVNVDEALNTLDRYFNSVDLKTLFPLDEPLPDKWTDWGSDGFKSAVEQLDRIVKEEKLTLRQLAIRNATRKDKGTFVGTPEQIADEIQEWFESEAVDGFIVSSGPIVPEGIHDFVNLVLPILQSRGLYRTEYEADTFRENIGVPIPPNRYRKQRA